MVPDIYECNVCIYDVEIMNAVGERHPDLGRPITWDDHEVMGLAVACAYSFKTGDYYVFYEKDVYGPEHGLAQLFADHDMISGFNILGFDNPILKKGYGCPSDIDAYCYDMLLHSRLSMGWTPRQRFPKGLNLDEHLKCMFDMQKTENAIDAPKFYKNGDLGRLTTYCLSDVRREALLLHHMWMHGEVATATHGKHFVKHHPHSILRRIKALREQVKQGLLTHDEIRSIAAPWTEGAGHA